MSFPKRTDTVENILQQPNVPYEEIFKTRLRVIDDRSPSQNTNYSEAKNTDRYLDQSANSHTNSNQASVRSSPVQKSTGRASPLVKADNLMHNKLSYKKVAWDSNRIKKVQNEQDNFKEIMTTSELLVLPELEIKYLEQYQLHTNYIMNINDKVDYLSKKVKEIKRFINDRVEEEQEALVPQTVKIQALFRGYLCRKKLIESGLPTFKRKRYYPNIAEVYHAAIKIQSLWRGYNIRKKHANQLQIDILKALVRKQGQQLKLQGDGHISKVSKDVNMLKMVVTSQQEEIAKFEKLNRSISQNNQELLSIFKEQQMEFYSLKEQFIKFKEESLLEVTKLKQELESLKSQKSAMIRAPSNEQLEFLSGIEEGLSPHQMYSNTCFPDFYLQQLAGCSTQSLNPLDGGVWGQHGHHPLMNYQYGSSFMHPFQSQALLNSSMGGCYPSHNFGGQMNFYGHPNQMIAHLLDARRGDILRNEIVYLVANNLRDVRNMDNIVRALSAGRPVGSGEVVKSVLADRIKDEKAARLLKAIATEQKLNHKVDDVINVLQSVSPAAEMQLARVNDHRRDVADRLFAKEAQSLLTHDLVSQAHLGSLGRNYGMNTFGCGTFGFAGNTGLSGNIGLANNSTFGSPIFNHYGLGNTLGTPGYLNPMGSGMENIDKYGSALQQVLASGV